MVKSRRGALALGVVAVLLLLWVAIPLLRSRLYLAVGAPARAWSATLRAAPSDSRDAMLIEIMQHPATNAAGELSTQWEAHLQGNFDDVRDPREPSWVRYGPHGKQVEGFVEDLRTWPWLQCGLPRPERSAELLAWRWVEYGMDDSARRTAEMDAFEAAHEMAQEAVLTALAAAAAGSVSDDQEDTALRCAISVSHLAAAAATEIQQTGRSEFLRGTVMALRSGHSPRPEDGACASCSHGAELAPGLVQSADGALLWTDRAGTDHTVGSFRW